MAKRKPKRRRSKVRPAEHRKINRRWLEPHPLNPRLHPEEQRKALKASIAEFGFVGEMLVRPHPDKKRFYQVIDGHARLHEFGPNEGVPCCVVQMTDDEVRKFIATYDRVTDLAEWSGDRLDELLDGITFDNDELNELVAGTLAEIEEIAKVEQHREQAAHHAGEADDQSDAITETWGVMVICDDEADQVQFLEEMEHAGRTVRVVNS